MSDFKDIEESDAIDCSTENTICYLTFCDKCDKQITWFTEDILWHDSKEFWICENCN